MVKNNGVTNLNIKSSIPANRDFSGFESYYLFDNLPDGVCILNERGYIKYFNSTYERILKVSNHLEVGASIFMTKSDDVILTAFGKKKSIHGNLAFQKGSSQSYFSQQ